MTGQANSAGAAAPGLPSRFSDAVEILHDIAADRTGLHDFGAPSYIEGLRRLLASLDDDLPRGPAEREACYASIIGPLVARLYAQAGWKHNPACLKHALPRPVFIVGAPRTGTTALHKLLSAAPCWQGIESWLARTPMTRPPRHHWANSREYRAARAAYETRMQAQPEFRVMRPVEPEDVDECILITAQTMISNTFGSIMHVPAYDAWFRAQDFRPAFRLLADNLRLIGAQDHDRRWLLKNPSHILDLEELLEVFSDAVVIHIHRDPVVAQPSLWSVLAQHHALRDGAGMNRRTIALREMDLYGAALMRATVMTQNYPARILDVFERDLHVAAIETASRVFAFAGENFTEAAESAIADWIVQNPAHKHGIHHYAAEDHGIAAEEIAERFAAYRAQYGFGQRQ
jgi:hypothetical protein